MTESQLAAQRFDDGTILASSPIREQRGCEPSRIVLRKVNGHYVVHMQIFPGPQNDYRNPYYIHGNYIPGGDEKDLHEAWDRFEKRTRQLFDMQTVIEVDRRESAVA